MLAVRWLAGALFVVAVPLFLLLTNVRIAAMEPRVYEYSYSANDVPAVTGIDRPQLDRAARDIVAYFRNDEPFLGTRVTIAGAEQPLFSPREVLHMRDVKDLFQLVFTLHEIAFVYIVAYVAAVFVWSHERSLARLGQQLVRAGVATAAGLALAAAAVFVGFDNLFEQFHLLSFSNDLWLLDPSRDHLIQMFPRDFWFNVSLAVGVATIFEGGLVALLGIALRARYRLRRPSSPAPPLEARSPAQS